MQKNKKKKLITGQNVLVIISIVALVLISGIVIFVSNPDKKINDNFSLAKEDIKITTKEKQINLKILLKNTTNKKQKIDNISLDIINKDGEKTFYYYKNIGKEIKSKETYELNIKGSLEQSNLKSIKDIKDIKYKINN